MGRGGTLRYVFVEIMMKPIFKLIENIEQSTRSLTAAIKERYQQQNRPICILTNQDGFLVKRGATTLSNIRFCDVEEVIVFKRDEWTTDLICCDIKSIHGSGELLSVVLHEEMPGFDKMMHWITLLPGAKEDWWSAVAFPPFAQNLTQIYKRNPDPPGPQT